MGRFILTLASAVGVWLIACSAAGAWPGKSDKNAEATPAAPSAAQESANSLERAEREKAMRDWQAKLSGSRWELEVVVSKGGPATVVQPDVLTFERGTISSDTLAKAGYEHAPYSLYPPTKESIAWEAMQHKEEKGIQEAVIWRGEVTGETMQGTLIKKRTKGEEETVETLSFTGRRMAAAPEPTPPAAQTAPSSAAPAQTAPAATPEVPATAHKEPAGSS